MEHHKEGIDRREKHQKPRVALEAITKLFLDIFLLPLDLVNRTGFSWSVLLLVALNWGIDIEKRCSLLREKLILLLLLFLVKSVLVIQSDHASHIHVCELMGGEWRRLLLLVLHALQVEHLVGLLPWEKDRGDHDEEHVEGQLIVDLLPCDRLFVHVELRIVRSDDEAHDDGESECQDHGIHGKS